MGIKRKEIPSAEGIEHLTVANQNMGLLPYQSFCLYEGSEPNHIQEGNLFSTTVPRMYRPERAAYSPASIEIKNFTSLLTSRKYITHQMQPLSTMSQRCLETLGKPMLSSHSYLPVLSTSVPTHQLLHLPSLAKIQDPLFLFYPPLFLFVRKHTYMQFSSNNSPGLLNVLPSCFPLSVSPLNRD